MSCQDFRLTSRYNDCVSTVHMVFIVVPASFVVVVCNRMLSVPDHGELIAQSKCV